VKGYLLEPPKISLGQSASTKNPRYTKLNQGIFKVRDKCFNKAPLNYWIIFYTGWNKNHEQEAVSFAKELRSIGKGLDVDVRKPTFI